MRLLQNGEGNASVSLLTWRGVDVVYFMQYNISFIVVKICLIDKDWHALVMSNIMTFAGEYSYVPVVGGI